MAASQTLRKVGQAFSGLCLGLTGSWLLVICVGGLLTLGVLSLFHVGVLLSLGCIGVCLLVAGVSWFCDALSKDHPEDAPEDAKGWSFQNHDTVSQRSMDETVSPRQRFNPQHRSPKSTEASAKQHYNPFG